MPEDQELRTRAERIKELREERIKDLTGPTDIVHLPQVLNDEFGFSLEEARRILRTSVEIDGRAWTGFDIPLDDIDGKTVRITDQTKSLMFVYRKASDRYFE